MLSCIIWIQEKSLVFHHKPCHKRKYIYTISHITCFFHEQCQSEQQQFGVTRMAILSKKCLEALCCLLGCSLVNTSQHSNRHPSGKGINSSIPESQFGKSFYSFPGFTMGVMPKNVHLKKNEIQLLISFHLKKENMKHYIIIHNN